MMSPFLSSSFFFINLILADEPISPSIFDTMNLLSHLVVMLSLKCTKSNVHWCDSRDGGIGYIGKYNPFVVVLFISLEDETYVQMYWLIKIREFQRGNQKWTIQRNWQHREHKDEEKQQNMCWIPLFTNKHNKICVRYHYVQTNTT